MVRNGPVLAYVSVPSFLPSPPGRLANGVKTRCWEQMTCHAGIAQPVARDMLHTHSDELRITSLTLPGLILAFDAGPISVLQALSACVAASVEAVITVCGTYACTHFMV